MSVPMVVPQLLAAENFLLPNATFIAEVGAFLIILAVFWKYVVPPLQKSMNERQELIRKQFTDSREAQERLDAAEAQYKNALAETRTQSARITEEARQQGQRIIDEMRAKAELEAARVAERAEARLESERQQIMQELRAEVGRLAMDLASRIVGESLEDDARQRRVADRFLAALEDGAGASTTGQEPVAPAPTGAQAG